MALKCVFYKFNLYHVIKLINNDTLFISNGRRDQQQLSLLELVLLPTKTGHMVEEWRVSAHDTAKRILLQQCTREAAGMVGENKSTYRYVDHYIL